MEQKKVVAVGAGLGVPLGLLFVLFLVLFVLEKRKNDGSKARQSAGSGEKFVGVDTDAQGGGDPISMPAELDEDRAKHELGANGMPLELAGGRGASMRK